MQAIPARFARLCWLDLPQLKRSLEVFEIAWNCTKVSDLHCTIRVGKIVWNNFTSSISHGFLVPQAFQRGSRTREMLLMDYCVSVLGCPGKLSDSGARCNGSSTNDLCAVIVGASYHANFECMPIIIHVPKVHTYMHAYIHTYIHTQT